jgi:hypothetical protein
MLFKDRPGPGDWKQVYHVSFKVDTRYTILTGSDFSTYQSVQAVFHATAGFNVTHKTGATYITFNPKASGTYEQNNPHCGYGAKIWCEVQGRPLEFSEEFFIFQIH